MEEIPVQKPTIPPVIQTPAPIELPPVKKPFLSKAIIAIFIIVIIFILLPAGTYLFLNSNKQVACTTEAKICPDGSSVGRTGPKCEFQACPKTKPTPTCKPRPACLDATPRCMIPETSNMCLKANTSSPTPSGQSFTETGCKVGGCNGELCQNISDESIASICIYKESFACYKTARCEKQQDEKCGWTKTSELTSCIKNSN